LIGGFAQNDVWLIAARALQGLGAAMASPAALSIVTTTFAEGAERNRALGVWTAVAGAGAAAGVLLGGMLTEWVGWEAVLWVNVPIGLVAAWQAPKRLVESKVRSSDRNFDAPGASSQLVTRVGFKPTLIVGLLFTAAGLIWFSQADATGGTYLQDVLGPSILAAIGIGVSSVPATISAVTGTRPDEAGLASGLVNTSQQIGGALGLAILASVATSATKGSLAAGERNPLIALNEGFQEAFLVGAGFALIGVVLAAALISSRDSRKHAAAARRGEVAPVFAAG